MIISMSGLRDVVGSTRVRRDGEKWWDNRCISDVILGTLFADEVMNLLGCQIVLSVNPYSGNI